MTAERTAVGIAQWLAEPGLGEQNLETALGYVRELAEHGAELVVLPELWPSGYRVSSLGDDTRATAEPLDGPRGEALARVAVETGVWLAAGTVPELDGGTVYNSAVVYSPRGELVATHRKAYLYGSAEHEAFTAGDCLTTFEREPFGRVGLAVCFDGDFPETARALGRAGAQLVLLPSAYEVEAAESWDRIYPANAIANGQWWIMVNQCGAHGTQTLLGASRVLSPFGETIAEAVRAGIGETPDPELLVVELPLRAGLDAWQAGYATLLQTEPRELPVAGLPEPSRGGRR
ncbi:MAG TPA: carbon-nitrogen hydrolase family protein [Gaiellales bacterium]